MKMYCKSILKYLNQNKAIELQSKESLDNIGLESPFYDGYGFPPSLIPIASGIDVMSYYGIYIDNIYSLGVCYVNLSIEDSNLYEIAISQEQFVYYLSYDAIVNFNDDEEDDAKMSSFCEELGVFDYRLLQKLASPLEHPVYKSNLTPRLLSNKPGAGEGETGYQKHSLGYENDPFELTSRFDNALDNQDYQLAWNILNSPGWELKNAKDSFKRLVMYQKWIFYELFIQIG